MNFKVWHLQCDLGSARPVNRRPVRCANSCRHRRIIIDGFNSVSGEQQRPRGETVRRIDESRHTPGSNPGAGLPRNQPFVESIRSGERFTDMVTGQVRYSSRHSLRSGRRRAA